MCTFPPSHDSKCVHVSPIHMTVNMYVSPFTWQCVHVSPIHMTVNVCISPFTWQQMCACFPLYMTVNVCISPFTWQQMCACFPHPHDSKIILFPYPMVVDMCCIYFSLLVLRCVTQCFEYDLIISVCVVIICCYYLHQFYVPVIPSIPAANPRIICCISPCVKRKKKKTVTFWCLFILP